jgi:hypothetical protein
MILKIPLRHAEWKKNKFTLAKLPGLKSPTLG